MTWRLVTDDRCKALVERALDGITLGPYACIGMEREGEVTAAFLFNGFTGYDAHATAAGSRLTRGFMVEVGRFAFDFLKLGRLTFTTDSPRVVSLNEKMGARIEGCLRDHFGPGRDGIIMGCLANEWRYR